MFDRTYRNLVHRGLSTLRQGHLSVSDAGQTERFGDEESALKVEISIHDRKFYRHMVLGGGLGAAESLARGHWSCPDLTSLVRILVRNLPEGDAANGPLSKLKNTAEKAGHWLRRNNIGNAKQNIGKHYDLSNEFFALFLDPSMTYSCAIFPNSDSSLYEASIEKIDRVCRKLNLRSSDHLLEIGTGWGGLAAHAARHYGCRVTTTTISDQQYNWSLEKFESEGLSDRITLLKEDYRNLTGTYDKLASIEMIEAVGYQYYNTFFEKCSELLKPEGEMMIQAITIVDHRFEHHKNTVDFINRYIFPGGCLPSVNALTNAMAQSSRLRLVHLEDFAAHYAETLRRWRSSFMAKLDYVRQLGFDERFIRIWEYYLCYCEAAFMERHVNVSQLWFANHQSKVSPLDRCFDAGPSSTRHQTVRSDANHGVTSEVTL